MEIKDRGLNEKINQLKKGLEIVGGKSNLLLEQRFFTQVESLKYFSCFKSFFKATLGLGKHGLM